MPIQPMTHVLVLGATGLVGQTVYQYLKKQPTLVVRGTTTSSTDGKLEEFLFTGEKSQVAELFTGSYRPDLVINCVGLTPAQQPSTQQYKLLNTQFPVDLAKCCADKRINCVHISTDAVFGHLAGQCWEDSLPLPDPSDRYAHSKLAGEPLAETTVTLRSSFIGFDAFRNSGLLEWAMAHAQQPIQVYAQCSWSGCTTLQFAQLCHWLVEDSNFRILHQVTPLLHFAPLKATKAQVIEELSTQADLGLVIDSVNQPVVTRQLYSRYTALLPKQLQQQTIAHAIQQLLRFKQENTE